MGTIRLNIAVYPILLLPSSPRHYHKALTSERRYHQLLSASSNTSEVPTTPQNYAHTPETESVSSPHVCRQLSGAFASVEGQHVSAGPPQQHVPGFHLAGTSLEEQGSNDVFNEDEEGTEPCGRPHLVDWEQPASSPQVLVRGRGSKPNPLAFLSSQTSSLSIHQRKQSSGEPLTSNSSHLPRRTSAPARTPSWTSGPLGYHGNTTVPLSPLAAGRKSRTPSGKVLLIGRIIGKFCWYLHCILT